MERLWKRTNRDSGCWLWTGAVTAKGYGAIKVGGRKGKVWLAHRLAWALVNGDIPSGMKVLHECDTPLCINPDHLFLGTSKDNSVDMENKGRTGRCYGLHNGRHKLTMEIAESIREEHEGGASLRVLAKKYGVANKTIWRITNGITWVPGRECRCRVCTQTG